MQERTTHNIQATIVPNPLSDLSEQTIHELKKALLNEKNLAIGGKVVRYSKRYLQKNLGIAINRGGIIRVTHAEGQAQLYATMKDKKLPMQLLQQFPQGKSVLHAEGGTSQIFKIYQIDNPSNVLIMKRLKSSPKLEHSFFAVEAEHYKTAVAYKMKEDQLLDDKKGRFLVMPYIEGRDLETVLDEDRMAIPRKKISPLTRLIIALRIVQETAKLHQSGFVHRDIKTANFKIQFDANLFQIKIKLIDFAYKIPLGQTGPQVISGMACRPGTPGYIPPEVWLLKAGASISTDTYAMGFTFRDIFGKGFAHTIAINNAVVQSGCPADFGAWAAFTQTERDILKSLCAKMIAQKECDRLILTDVIERSLRHLIIMRLLLFSDFFLIKGALNTFYQALSNDPALTLIEDKNFILDLSHKNILKFNSEDMLTLTSSSLENKRPVNTPKTSSSLPSDLSPDQNNTPPSPQTVHRFFRPVPINFNNPRFLPPNTSSSSLQLIINTNPNQMNDNNNQLVSANPTNTFRPT